VDSDHLPLEVELRTEKERTQEEERKKRKRNLLHIIWIWKQGINIVRRQKS